ncbi:hypothetical protein BDDG_13072 [Blastomyces dermatitidis ATCC 18188]|uniref:Uncharacterized protein n=1 Tax=Ajellomyces dermatitidis (strain ATCC 18188 / CBS 674.68) TaxID=653446 RepID=A0A0J9ERA5_AJEDA|nr:hypothetical protein BDDG_13072 [Blastomyces dermatitidis ATCC 18188]
MASHSHNKRHHSAHTRQFISKQHIIMDDNTPSYTLSTVSLLKLSHVDRFTSVNDSELNVESLIKNLENVIIKELSVLYVTKSSVFLSSFSVSSSAAPSQSPTPTSVSGSPASATSVPMTLTSATSGFTVSAFVISSP